MNKYRFFDVVSIRTTKSMKYLYGFVYLINLFITLPEHIYTLLYELETRKQQRWYL